MNIDDLEAFVLDEIKAEKSTTFMYNLHKEKLFYKDKFDLLIEKSEQLFTYYCSDHKTDNSGVIAEGLIVLLEHMLFSFYCNAEPSDLYKIKNYRECLSVEIIADYYFVIRNLSSKIIKVLAK